MKGSIEYIRDSSGRIWRVNYEEGIAESMPASFTDLGSKPPENDIIKYEGEINDYLRKQGTKGLEYNFKKNEWIFEPDGVI